MKLKYWHAIALIFCILWVAYYPALFAPLNTVDDLRMVNEQLARPVAGWIDIWFPNSVTYYRPLINGSFILDRFLWNLETPFLHFENILLHWVNTLLVFSLTRLVASKLALDAIKVPLVAALAFAVHPINTEAVIWVAGRADLLMTSFVLICLICTIRFLLTPHWLWLIAVFLSFALGCFAKETALFVLPGVLLFCFGLRQQGQTSGWPQWSVFGPALICLLGTVCYFSLRFYALRDRDLGLQHVTKTVTLSPETDVSLSVPSHVSWDLLWHKLETALTVAGFYARKLIQPMPLNFGIIDVPAGYFWVGCLVLLFGIILIRKQTLPGVFFLTAMSLGSVSLLVALGNISWTPIAERYMYAPVAMTVMGITLAGAISLQKSKSGFWPIAVRWCLPLLLLAGMSGALQRGFVWQDNLTLFSDTVAKSPDFTLAQNELAKVLWERGRKSEALEILKSLKVPDSQEASLNKVLVLIDEGRLEDAREFLLDKLQSKTSGGYRTSILQWLDKVLGLLKEHSDNPEQILNYDQERLLYLERLHNNTRDPFYLYRIGQVKMSLGDYVGARMSFAAAHDLLPNKSPYKLAAGRLAERLRLP